MSCPSELVTGYVDGALTPADRALVEDHLSRCADCRTQAREERELRLRLRQLPAAEVPFGMEQRFRRRIRGGVAARWALVAGLAATFLLGVLWLRSAPGYVAMAVARDHTHCFAQEQLPAQVWSSDPEVIENWFAARGRHVPDLPTAAAGLELVGARFCPLIDASRAAHIYYASKDQGLSVFVLANPPRLDGPFHGALRGRSVALLRTGGTWMGVVGDKAEPVEAMSHALTHSYVRGQGALPRRDADLRLTRPVRVW